MIGKGDKAPDFVLSDQDGREVSLSGLLKAGKVLLYFYPADFTPGCTKEACTFRDMHPALNEAGVTVIGISPQDAGSHERFSERHNLPFPLLADTKKDAIKSYGVDGPLGVGVRRATYLIGSDGIVEDVTVADFRIGKHADFARSLIT